MTETYDTFEGSLLFRAPDQSIATSPEIFSLIDFATENISGLKRDSNGLRVESVRLSKNELIELMENIASKIALIEEKESVESTFNYSARGAGHENQLHFHWNGISLETVSSHR